MAEKDFKTENQVRNLIKKKISYIVFHLKKGNNLENLQIEFEKFKCSDYDKDPILLYFDCWIYKFNELLDFNLLELYVNREDGNYFIIVEAKEQKRFLLQFIECILDLMANDTLIENEKRWIKLKKPIRNYEKQWIQKYEKPNIFNCICQIFG